MSDAARYFRARHVATMTPAGVVDDGCVVVVDGRIEAVGLTRDLKPPRIDEDIDGLLTPGLINAHTHLELTHIPRPPTPGTFQNWLLTTMAAAREADAEVFARKCVEAVRAGLDQCVRFGVTCVGDISQNVDLVRPIFRDAAIRSISYGECLGLGPRRERFDDLLRRAADAGTQGGRMSIGIAPHAPYTVDAAGYVESYRMAARGNTSWTTHLAETPDESAFVFRRDGPFAGLYRSLGFDPGPSERSDGTPVAWLAELLGDEPLGLLAHVNDCSDADLDLLAARNATVTFCPRTHAYFGRPPHRWREMVRRGINVCVATDSCASSPDLNVMDDVRLLRTQSPEVDARALWDLVTSNAAGCFAGPGGACRNGILHPSRPDELVVADFVAWPTRTSDPLSEVLDTPSMRPAAVWVGGERVFA